MSMTNYRYVINFVNFKYLKYINNKFLFFQVDEFDGSLEKQEMRLRQIERLNEMKINLLEMNKNQLEKSKIDKTNLYISKVEYLINGLQTLCECIF